MLCDLRERLSRLTAALGAAGVVIVGASLIVPAAADAQAVKGTYLYTLSSFTGAIRQDWSRVAVDRERSEVYALYQNSVHVFNRAGMEIYRFGDDLDLGHIVDLAVDERGDIFLLAYKDSRWGIVRCDYRGRPQATITLAGLPAKWSGFGPNRMVLKRGTFYLVSTLELVLVTADANGNVTRSHDLFELFELEEKQRGAVELSGFSVDRDGNVLMTVPVLFTAFVLTPDGKLSAFGRAGGAPGRFNIASGIARDGKGNYLIVDKLKGAIQVFDRSYRFVTQFSTWGQRPGQLVAPDDIGIDAEERIYVTQASRRGISVFRLTYQ
jgi:DNA-binding beta-propeller fold protein YncE